MGKTQFIRHRKARQTLSQILDGNEKTLFVHYSCESFYDRPHGMSPRITSIAVKFQEGGQVKSFSIHQQAELHTNGIVSITPNYDQFEKEMLEKFYRFVGQHSTYIWVHWNMRDVNYGFEAIDHRFRVLGGEPKEILGSNKQDLSRVIYDLLGPEYVDHPRLYQLLRVNDMTRKELLEGADEARAFERGEYVKLHQSTLAKVESISQIANRAHAGTLKCRNSFFKKRGLSFGTVFDVMKEHPVYAVVGFLATTLAFLLGLVDFVELIS